MFLLSVALTGCLLLACVLLSKRQPFLAYSSVYGLALFYAFLAVGGCFLYPMLVDSRGASALIELSIAERVRTMNALLALAIAAVMGALCRSWLNPRQVVAAPRSASAHISLSTAACLCVPLVLFCLGVGVLNMLSRSEYLLIASPAAMTAGTALVPCAIVALGYFSVVGDLRSRYFSVAMLVMYLIACFAQATRLLAIAPLFFVAGRFFAGRSLRQSWVITIATLVALPLLMQLSLILRGLPEQGLLPFSRAVINGTVLEAPSMEAGVARNVFFGFDLTGHVIHDIPLTADDLWVSLTPAPGSMTDWEIRSQSLRVNIYTPFNATGELLNHGLIVAVAYYFVAGILLSRADALVTSSAGTRLFTVMPLLGLSWAFVIRSTQYNLRSVTRLLYYLLFGLCLDLLWRGLRTRALGRKSVVGTNVLRGAAGRARSARA